MKSFKLIATIVFSQIVLLLASFKMPTNSNKDSKKDLENKVLDTKESNDKLVVSKSFKIKQPNYTLDFHYPYINENRNDFSEVFNTYVKTNIINPNSKLNIDSNACEIYNTIRTKSLLDYKDYFQNEDFLSILLFKRDYFNGDDIPLYSFKTLNFNLKNGTFVKYKTIFAENTDQKLIEVINKKLATNLNHYECWELTESQFVKNKNNFTLSHNTIKFYFDDCSICPSHVGEFAVEVSLKEIKYLLAKNNAFSRFVN